MNEKAMNEPSKWAVDAAKTITDTPFLTAKDSAKRSWVSIIQSAIDSATAELVKERDLWIENWRIDKAKMMDAMIERDNWKACSEAEHAHKLKIVEEKNQRITAMSALLDRMPHSHAQSIYAPSQGCPACAWDKMKKEVEK